MYTTFMNQNANAFNLNLNDKFNNESKSQIINFNQQKFNNIMNNGKYNNNNHDFNYNKNNNNNNFNCNNFNIYNYNDNFYNNNNLNINKSFNNNNNNNNFNNNNNNNSNMMNMLNFLNTTWNMFRMFNNQKNVNHSATIQVINNNSNDFDSNVLRKGNITVIDINPKYQGVKINIFFQNSSGTKINVLSPSDITVKDLLLNYVKKIGLGENVIDSVIYFLFSGAKLKKDDERKIYELGMMNGAIIIVIDRNAVTGA